MLKHRGVRLSKMQENKSHIFYCYSEGITHTTECEWLTGYQLLGMQQNDTHIDASGQQG